jgi:hypothetical protein
LRDLIGCEEIFSTLLAEIVMSLREIDKPAEFFYIKCEGSGVGTMVGLVSGDAGCGELPLDAISYCYFEVFQLGDLSN